MRKLFGATAALLFSALFISSAQAINVTLADVQNGLAVVEGNKATRDTAITWENLGVGQTNKGGSFSFSSVVPADCVGTLTIGGTTIDVALTSCTPGGGGGAGDAPAPVAQTGQTTSFAAGDDGDLEKGVAWPSPRFTDNGRRYDYRPSDGADLAPERELSGGLNNLAGGLGLCRRDQFWDQ